MHSWIDWFLVDYGVSLNLYGFENGFVVIYDVLEDAEDGGELVYRVDFFINGK